MLIRLARVSQDLSQRQLAEAIPISQMHLSRFERGIAVPDALLLLAIAKILNQDIKYFYSGVALNLFKLEEDHER